MRRAAAAGAVEGGGARGRAAAVGELARGLIESVFPLKLAAATPAAISVFGFLAPNGPRLYLHGSDYVKPTGTGLDETVGVGPNCLNFWPISTEAEFTHEFK